MPQHQRLPLHVSMPHRDPSDNYLAFPQGKTASRDIDHSVARPESEIRLFRNTLAENISALVPVERRWPGEPIRVRGINTGTSSSVR